MSMLYDFRAYDKHLCLKVSFRMWLIIMYFLRPYILVFSTIRLGKSAGPVEGIDGLKQMVYPDDFSLTLGVLATLPVLIFIVAWAKRVPTAGTFIRSVWRNGALLLSVAAALNIVIVFVPMLAGVVSRIDTAGWIQIALPVIILVYLHTSKRVKDTFADFPAEATQ